MIDDEQIKTELKRAIVECSKNTRTTQHATDAMQFSQAAVNITNVLALIGSIQE